MTFQPPESFNMADYFLDDRIREGKGDRPAILTDEKSWTYKEVQTLANKFGNILRDAGVQPEQRVIIALPDGPEYVGALFGAFKIGAAAVMVNQNLKADAIEYFYDYTRAVFAVIHRDTEDEFRKAWDPDRHLKGLIAVGGDDFVQVLDFASDQLENHPTHRDDACLWLFSGGTTGKPKAVVQHHTSYANTTELYAKKTLGYTENDITMSVAKLFFGDATGSNLFFPFSVGAATALFPDRTTPETVFEKISKFKPTILINVPTMINKMLSHPEAANADLSSLRLSTSAGEALPEELYNRWKEKWGTEILDGLGTAEMWHIFISNRPGDVKPGTLGRVVEGFDVKVCDDDGNEVPRNDIGWLWVRGNSRAIGYWQNLEKTISAFRGDWYVSGDMIRMDEEGYVTYCGRGDDMLKVSGKWLSPKEVENCLLQHDTVKECAVVGVVDSDGLTKPHAFIISKEKRDGLDEELKTFVKERLEPYKYPRVVTFMDDFPRTHLGKIDRGKLRKS